MVTSQENNSSISKYYFYDVKIKNIYAVKILANAHHYKFYKEHF